MTDKLDERIALAAAKLATARGRLTRSEQEHLEAAVDVQRLERAHASLVSAKIGRGGGSLLRLVHGGVGTDSLQTEIDAVAKMRAEADAAVSRARTQDEFDSGIAEAERVRRMHGTLLLQRDRRDRPHIYARRAGGSR
jgi:hypothetical protein